MYFEVFSSTVIESKTKQINTKSWYKDFKDDLYQSLKVFSWEKSNFAEVIQKVPGDKTINSSICQHIICILKPKWMWLLNLENGNISVWYPTINNLFIAAHVHINNKSVQKEA